MEIFLTLFAVAAGIVLFVAAQTWRHHSESRIIDHIPRNENTLHVKGGGCKCRPKFLTGGIWYHERFSTEVE